MIFLYVVLAPVFLVAWVASFGWMKDENIFPLRAPVLADVLRFLITPVLVAGLVVYGVTTKILDAFCGDL